MERFPKLSRLLFGAVLVCLLGLTVSQAIAQDGSAIDNLRRGVPTSRDNGIVDDWINSRLSKLVAAVNEQRGNTVKASADFLAAFQKQYNHEDNSPDFKEKLAERTAEIALAEFRKENAKVEVPRALTRALGIMDSSRIREALLAGLTSKDQVVRYLSAKALAAIRDEIGVDARMVGLTLEELGKAGATEASDVVLAMIYRAACYKDHNSEVVEAMVKMLDGRLTRLRESGKNLGRSETEMAGWLAGAGLDNNQKAEVVRRMATLLRIYVKRYSADDVDESEKAAIQETIDAVESLLNKLVSPSKAPGVSDTMQKEGAAVAAEMELKLIEWIGSEGAEGILNVSPWNVPRGAP